MRCSARAMRSVEIGDPAREFAEVAGQARLGALQGQHLRLADQVLRDQQVLVLQLLGEQRHALLGGFHLGAKAADALLEAGDLLAENLLLGRAAGPAGLELGPLAVDDGPARPGRSRCAQGLPARPCGRLP